MLHNTYIIPYFVLQYPQLSLFVFITSLYCLARTYVILSGRSLQDESWWIDKRCECWKPILFCHKLHQKALLCMKFISMAWCKTEVTPMPKQGYSSPQYNMILPKAKYINVGNKSDFKNHERHHIPHTCRHNMGCVLYSCQRNTVL